MFIRSFQLSYDVIAVVIPILWMRKERAAVVRCKVME